MLRPGSVSDEARRARSERGAKGKHGESPHAVAADRSIRSRRTALRRKRSAAAAGLCTTGSVNESKMLKLVRVVSQTKRKQSTRDTHACGFVSSPSLEVGQVQKG